MLRIAIAALLLAGCTPATVGVDDPGDRSSLTALEFVRASGTALVAGDQPFRVIGFNVAGACGDIAADGLPAYYAQLAETTHATTARVWWFQIRGGPDNWSYFDAHVSAARAAGMRLVVTLVNQWGDCEPEVDGEKQEKDIYWFTDGYTRPDPGYALSYRDYARAVAEHYRDEPVVAMWQLVNEAATRSFGGLCSFSSESVLRAFADDMATLLHSVAPHHLVSLGTIGNDCGTVGAQFQSLHAGALDVCEYHDYNHAETAMPALLAQRIVQCAALGKPLFIGEVGMSVPDEVESVERRASLIGDKIDAALALGAVGELVWWRGVVDNYPDGMRILDGDPIHATLAARVR